MIKIKLNNNIKITSNSKVSAPDLLTFYHIKYELSIAGLFLFQPQSYQPFIPKQTTKKTLISSFKDSNMVIQIFHPGLQAQVFTNIREVVTPHSNYDVGDGAPWQWSCKHLERSNSEPEMIVVKMEEDSCQDCCQDCCQNWLSYDCSQYCQYFCFTSQSVLAHTRWRSFSRV